MSATVVITMQSASFCTMVRSGADVFGLVQGQIGVDRVDLGSVVVSLVCAHR